MKDVITAIVEMNCLTICVKVVGQVDKKRLELMMNGDEVSKMNKDDCKFKREETKDGMVTIRVSSKLKKWLKRNKYSPTLIFMEAVKKLGYKK